MCPLKSRIPAATRPRRSPCRQVLAGFQIDPSPHLQARTQADQLARRHKLMTINRRISCINRLRASKNASCTIGKLKAVTHASHTEQHVAQGLARLA